MFNRKVSLAVIALTLFSVMVACTPNATNSDDPRGRLTAYISHSFSVKGPDDRADLVSFLSGEAKERLVAWSDEQFRQAFVESRRQFVKLQINEVKPVSATESSVTYELSYIDQSKGKDAKVTQKKLCQMVLQDGKWMISDVKNIKELIEYRNEMALP